ncbi:MAG: hypothetical protein HQ510_07120 [Candidatus Marinimicrobia bacterium]|nr:hypothetical protein [Candidatus Neomarinimicrobiota bacterium]
MGAKDFSEFVLTIGHFENRRWVKAADEMLKSRWYREQTPERAKRLSEMVRKVVVK